MPKHFLHGLEREIELAADQDLWTGLRRAGVPIASACEGEGICGRCALSMQGALPPASPEELRCMAQQGVAPGLRLACCVRSAHPLELHAPYWGVRKS